MPSTPDTHRSVIDVLMSHRSVRSFKPEPLEPGVLERLVTAGTRASTSGNMQAYTVISVTEPELKKRVAQLCADQPQVHQSAAFLVFCADLHKLSLACRMHRADDGAAGEPEALLLAVIDAALFMQNVAVAAESLGLGICMIGAIRNHPGEVAKALKLPKLVVAIAGFCIGRPADEGEIKPRLPLDATLHREQYRCDEELERLIAEYDEVQSAWYRQRHMHPTEPRWSAVMSDRLPAVTKRAGIGRFLREQGLNTL